MFPEWTKRIPGQQSIEKTTIANIVNMDSVSVYGPVGASATFTHGLVKPGKPLGEARRTDSERGNTGISDQCYGS